MLIIMYMYIYIYIFFFLRNMFCWKVRLIFAPLFLVRQLDFFFVNFVVTKKLMNPQFSHRRAGYFPEASLVSLGRIYTYKYKIKCKITIRSFDEQEESQTSQTIQSFIWVFCFNMSLAKSEILRLPSSKIKIKIAIIFSASLFMFTCRSLRFSCRGITAGEGASWKSGLEEGPRVSVKKHKKNAFYT